MQKKNQQSGTYKLIVCIKKIELLEKLETPLNIEIGYRDFFYIRIELDEGKKNQKMQNLVAKVPVKQKLEEFSHTFTIERRKPIAIKTSLLYIHLHFVNRKLLGDKTNKLGIIVHDLGGSTRDFKYFTSICRIKSGIAVAKIQYGVSYEDKIESETLESFKEIEGMEIGMFGKKSFFHAVKNILLRNDRLSGWKDMTNQTYKETSHLNCTEALQWVNALRKYIDVKNIVSNRSFVNFGSSHVNTYFETIVYYVRNSRKMEEIVQKIESHEGIKKNEFTDESAPPKKMIEQNHVENNTKEKEDIIY